MIVVMKADHTPEQEQAVMARLRSFNLAGQPIQGVERRVIAGLGQVQQDHRELISLMAGVYEGRVRDEPGMGSEPPAPPAPSSPEDGGDPSEGSVPQFLSRYQNSERALQKAIDVAFAGVDYDELEAAWKASILRIPDPPPR